MQINRWFLTLCCLVLAAGLGCAEYSLDGGGSYGMGPGGAGDDDDDDDSGSDAGQLTAGEWRDLDHWDFWRDLCEGDESSYTEMEDLWGFDTADRVAVVVLDGDDPVVDARVKLKDDDDQILWETRTDNQGRAELFASPLGGQYTPPLRVMASSGNWMTSQSGVEPTAGDPVVLNLDEAGEPDEVADVLFAIDTTGSMSDELSYLQTELRDVLERAADESGLTLRVSVNFYRDHGDAYVVRSNPFTSDIGAATSVLMGEHADGGGDKPEAVDEALEDAVLDHLWSDSARARLLFLVLDAPPHREQEDLARLHQVTAAAAEAGIRIIPVVASGMDKEGEFLLRITDILTGGTYVFLTDDSGIGDEHLEPTVGDYEVEYLNDLLLRLILEYSE